MITSLYLPQTKKEITDFNEIQKFLDKHGVEISRWKANFPLKETDDQETVLKAYEHELSPYMKKHGYLSADVINVHKDMPNVEELRGKFLKEHTHSENEIRFFVDGSGYFWFNFNDGTIARLNCVKGDFLSVPQGFKHWFDLAPHYFVKAIRIFTNKEGWVANYTGSGVDAPYNKA